MWKLRYWLPEQPRPTVAEVYDARGIGADLQHVIDNLGCTRVEAVRRGHPAEPKKTTPVKARRIEWVQQEHTNGEFWHGLINGKVVADVFASRWPGRDPHYTLHLGPLSLEYMDCASVESGKRAAQAALTKVVKLLTE